MSGEGFDDTLRYVEDALDLLPSDPQDATPDDLARLAAINEGATRFVLQLHEAVFNVARRLASDTEIPAELVDEYLVLQVLHRRAERADRRLTTYTVAASAACGVNLAGSGEHMKE